MEIVIKGEGEIIIRFVNYEGKTLIERKIVTSGSETIQAKTNISLMAKTISGQVSLIPVLVYQSNLKQEITFEGENPSKFCEKRCYEMNCAPSVVEDIECRRVKGLGLNRITIPHSI